MAGRQRSRKAARPLSVPAIPRKLISERAADTLREHLRARPNAFYRLPSIAALSSQLGVSVVNVHRAVGMLRDEGLLDVVRGKGVFTRPAVHSLPAPAGGPAIGVVCYSEKVAIDYLAQGHGFYNLIMRGVVSEAMANDYRVVLHWIPSTFPQNPGRWPEVERFCSENEVRGLLLMCLVEEDLIEWLAARVKPCILLDHWTRRVRIDTVNPDNHGAAYAGTRHLIERGHKRIAYIFHRKREMNPPRLQGYLDALRDAGIPQDKDLVIPAEVTERGGEQGARQLLESGAEFTALMTFDTSQLTGALNVLGDSRRAANLPLVTFGVPEDTADPRVTLVDLQPQAVGEVAIRRLFARLNNPALPAEDLTAPARLTLQATQPAPARPAKT